MGVYLRIKFQVSSIILTSCREVGQFYHPPQNKPLKYPPTLGLIWSRLKRFLTKYKHHLTRLFAA